MIDDYWGPAKRVMGDAKFIENISNFDKELFNRGFFGSLTKIRKLDIHRSEVAA